MKNLVEREAAYSKKELLHCCQRRKNETVFEFLAVGNRRIAVLLYIVKGGVNSQCLSLFFSLCKSAHATQQLFCH